MLDTLLEPTTFTLGEFEFEIECTSWRCREDLHRGSHPAHYLVRFTCMHSSFWCNARWAEYVHERQRPEHRILCEHCRQTGVVTFWIPLSKIQT